MNEKPHSRLSIDCMMGCYSFGLSNTPNTMIRLRN